MRITFEAINKRTAIIYRDIPLGVNIILGAAFSYYRIVDAGKSSLTSRAFCYAKPSLRGLVIIQPDKELAIDVGGANKKCELNF